MSVQFTDSGQRKLALGGVRRLVVKVGTRLLTGAEGFSEAERVRQLIGEIAAIRDKGIEVILVTSGAIGAGMGVLGTPARPHLLPELQAHAAVGQSRLMYLYEKACSEHQFHCAQILLTGEDVQNRERHLNVRSCIEALLARGVLPVINENDSVSVDEIRFGDNDVLAALAATMVRAELTVLLTNVDGLRANENGRLGRRFSVISALDDETRSMAGDTADTQLSVGGMQTKLKAAETVTRAGETMWIADGSQFTVLRQILAAEDVGTLFTPRAAVRMKSQKRYLAFFSGSAGRILVDDGAARAVREGGRSLLPSGIKHVSGEFRRGDTVSIVNLAGDVIARGVSNYDAREVKAIKGRKTGEISGILGYDGYDVVVHRNYMVLVD